MLFGMGLSEKLQFGAALPQEQLDDLSMAFHLGLKRALHLVLGEFRIINIDNPANQQKGDKGTDQGNQNKLPMQP
jgi:hypothetical protein